MEICLQVSPRQTYEICSGNLMYIYFVSSVFLRYLCYSSVTMVYNRVLTWKKTIGKNWSRFLSDMFST